MVRVPYEADKREPKVVGAYGLWQLALAAEFFGDGCADQSLALYVDDEIADEFAVRHGLRESLVAAVAGQISWNETASPLWSVVKQCRAWEAGGQSGPPPSLPVLACSVLAATRMATSDGMLRTNYYGRWAQLFGEAPHTRRANVLEHSFEEVVWMWQSLDEWLDAAGGLFGGSTISTEDHFWRIGYPLSQALIRTSDREVLTRFFAVTGLRAGNPARIPGRELVRRLRIWTAGRDRKLTPRLLEEVGLASRAAPGEVPMLAGILGRLADEWDGTLHEPGRGHRRRAAGLRLLLTERGRRLEWTADTVEGVATARVGFPEGRSFTLNDSYGSVYSGLGDLVPSEVQIRQGLHLPGEELVLDWSGKDVVLLRLHPHLGTWASTEYFEPGEDHWIIAAPGAAGEVRTMVNNLRTRPAPEAAAPLSGWTVFKGVRALDGAAFGKTLQRGGTYIDVLDPPIRERASLAGGLQITREYRAGAGVAGHFLKGGEPDLLLPTTTEADGRVAVVLDGVMERLVADPRVPFPLQALSFLEEGDHRIGTAAHQQVFTLWNGMHEGIAPGTGTLAQLYGGSRGAGVGEFEGQEDAVCGALIPSGTVPGKQVTVPCAAEEAYFLSPQGPPVAIPLRPVPEWAAKRLGEAFTAPAFEVAVPERCAWLVIREGERWSTRPVVPEAQIPAPAPGAEDYRWSWLVLTASKRAGTPKWQSYVAAARQIAGTGAQA